MSLAVCVLGCSPTSAAFARRANAAAGVYRSYAADVVVACGGRSWSGVREADELSRRLQEGGVPASAILKERRSLDTHGNARHAARVLRDRRAKGLNEVVVVTCSWHLPRAAMLFRAHGFDVQGVGVEPPSPSLFARMWWPARETVSLWKDLLRLPRRPRRS